MATLEFTDAVRRAQARREISRVLQSLALDASDRRSVLIDLLAEDEVAGSAVQLSLLDPARTEAVGSSGGHRGAPKMVAMLADGHADESTQTAQVLDLLRMYPRMPIGVMASQIFGDENPTSRKRVRSALNALKRQGKVTATARGAWVAMP